MSSLPASVGLTTDGVVDLEKSVVTALGEQRQILDLVLKHGDIT